MAQPPERQSQAPQETLPTKPSIHMVESYPEHEDLMRTLIELTGFEGIITATPTLDLTIKALSQTTTHPNLIITHLTDLENFSLLEKLRKRNSPYTNTPVIALHTSPDLDVIERYKQFGASPLLAPYDIHTFENMVRTIFQPKKPT